MEQLNRAVDGDVVAVELLEQSSWSAPAEVVLEDDGYDPGDTLESDKDVMDQALKAKDVKPTGRVVGIIRRKWRQYCGILQENPAGDHARMHIFVPAEKKIPKIRIETRQAQKGCIIDFTPKQFFYIIKGIQMRNTLRLKIRIFDLDGLTGFESKNF